MRVRQYQAAGGVIVRDGRLLLLRKRVTGEIVLPKGHVEAGETLEAAALREAREETGYQNLRILADLGTGHAEFALNGEWIVRDETYYLMALLDEARDDRPDHADAAYDARVFEQLWVPAETAADHMSFEAARASVRRAAEWLKATQ